MNKPIILIADDELPFHQNIITAFDSINFVSVYNVNSAKYLIKNINFNLLLCDIIFDEGDPSLQEGIEIMKFAQEIKPNLPIIASSKYLPSKELQDRIQPYISDIFDKKTFIKQKHKWLEIIKKYVES